MPYFLASFQSLTPPLRQERSKLCSHLGALVAEPDLLLAGATARLPFSVTNTQFSTFGSRKTSRLWTFVSLENVFSPALRAGRSRPVSHSGPLLSLRGGLSAWKPGPTARLP